MSAPLDSSETDATSPSLLLRIRNDDAEAWERFDHLYRPLIQGWCKRFGLDAAAAEDATQEVSMRVRRAISGFKKSEKRHRFRKWLYTIARNVVNDQFRANAKEPAIGPGGSTALKRVEELPDDEPDDWSTSGELSNLILVRRAMSIIKNDFAEKTWAAFYMSMVQGIPSAEVCQQLAMQPNARRVACFRVKNRLRAELEDLIDEVLGE